MAKPVYTQIRNVVLYKLASMEPPLYYAKPIDGAVVPTSFFAVDFLESAYDYVILVRSQDETLSEDVGGGTTHEAEFFLLAARRFQTTGTEPYNVDQPRRQDIEDEIADDIEKLFQRDVFLRGGDPITGGTVVNARITHMDRTVFVEGWAIVQARLAVQYDTSIYAL
jgi:hypothetical protein